MKITVIGFLPLLPVYQMHGSKWWVTLEDYRLTIAVDGSPHTFYVPAGYRYDRATIWWQGVITKDHLGCIAPLIHDVLCTFKGKLPDAPIVATSTDTPNVAPYRTFTRPEADNIFKAVMLADRVEPWRAELARFFVSFGRNW